MSAKPEADPQLGRTLGGQYRIEALLGAGGMGRVYRGRQLSVNRPVAIKVIAGQAPHPREWVQRFRREAEATASLSHPNSVRLFDFGVTESEELFMVMELLEGNDLARQLQARGPLPLAAALAIARQVLLALCEAHALGITHRDIKPDNIFLASVRGADVVAKVMDFGIAGIAQAQRKSRLTGAGMIIGTPMYMSPEQAQGLRVDGKSDVYSLGVVLFEMLTGRPVFESHTAVTLLLAHVARAPMRLEEAGVQLREQSSLQTLLDRLLSKDPNERPSAAEALDTVTAISTRLGIAGATGTMRALDLNPAAPPATARRGTPRAAAARDADAGSAHATPPSASGGARAASSVAGPERGGEVSARRTGPQPGADQVALASFDEARDPGASTPTAAPSSAPLSAASGTRTPDVPLANATGPRAQGSSSTAAASRNAPLPAASATHAPDAFGDAPLPTASGTRAQGSSSTAAASRNAPLSAASATHSPDAFGVAPLSTASGQRKAGALQAELGPGAAPPSAASGVREPAGATGSGELDGFLESAASLRAEQAFQSARAPRALTGAQLRPGLALLGAGLVISAASALAFRWAPSLLDAAKPLAAVGTLVATPDPAPLPAQRTVLIDSQPSAAQVLVNGEPVGNTPYQLKVRADTEVSVAREGYARQLVKVPYDSRAPLLVKLAALPDKKLKGREEQPPVYSIKQESQPRIGPRADADHERRDREPSPARSARIDPQHERTARTPQPSRTETTEHSALDSDPPVPEAPLERSANANTAELAASANTATRTNKADPVPSTDATALSPPADGPRGANAAHESAADVEPEPTLAHVHDRLHEPQATEQAHGSGLDVARVLEMGREPGTTYAPARAAARERAAEIASEHTPTREPPSAAETSRSAATRIEAVREDELAEISLDDDERAHVAQHYGLRAIGRAVARAFGRLLIPYPNRERRAALAKMPLSYSSFREARAAYKQRDIDGTAFQEAVWQLRERRRQRIWTERDRYARGELTQGQYEARVDRIWDEFWGPQ